MIVGANGAGKTATVGKIANKFLLDKKKVGMVAADTFRAAAIEQLKFGQTEQIHIFLAENNSRIQPHCVLSQLAKLNN